MMARSSEMRHYSCCVSGAAETSSARISSIMDTAIALVVSIIICLLSLRLRM